MNLRKVLESCFDSAKRLDRLGYVLNAHEQSRISLSRTIVHDITDLNPLDLFNGLNTKKIESSDFKLLFIGPSLVAFVRLSDFDSRLVCPGRPAMLSFHVFGPSDIHAEKYYSYLLKHWFDVTSGDSLA